MKKQVVVLVLAAVLVFGCAVGGTLAWLMDQTETITNVFTAGNVDIELDESDDLDLKMIPGETITKDPKVTVKGGSEDCYVFVKIDENETLVDFISYTVNSNWKSLEDDQGKTVDGVYYIEQNATDTDVVYSVIANDTVSVINSVTKDQLNKVTNETIEAPELSFTAYAIQSANLTDVGDVYEAWLLVSTPAQQD